MQQENKSEEKKQEIKTADRKEPLPKTEDDSLEEKKQEIKAEDKKEQLPKDEEKSLEELDDGIPLILISKEKKTFSVDKKSAYMSNYVKTLATGDKSSNEVLVDGVSSDILALVVEYITHHKGIVPPPIQRPLQHMDMAKVTEAWDAQFIDKIGFKTLLDLILGANYMDITCLLHLGCAKLATHIKGKNDAQIKDMFEAVGIKKAEGQPPRRA